jgi:hypothetical protein
LCCDSLLRAQGVVPVRFTKLGMPVFEEPPLVGYDPSCD